MSERDIGGRIRNAREHRGLSLSDAAASTKLSVSVVRAIESNDFATLPPAMYRKAYVRTLAAAVGLDPNAVAADFTAAYEPPDVLPSGASLAAPTPDKWIEQRTPPSRATIATMVWVAILMAAWLWLEPDAAVRPVPVDNRVEEPLAAPAFVNSHTHPANPEESRAGSRVATSEELREAPLKIEVGTTGWCWVDAESDGERVFYGLVEPGQRIVLEGHRGISLRLGDGGAVTVTINGGPARTPGASGEVIELEITPESVEGLRVASVVTGAFG